MQKITNKNQKIILSLLVILVMLPSFLFLLPQKANALWGIGDCGLDCPSNVAGSVSNATGAAAGTTGAAAGTANAATSASGLGIATNTWYGKLLDQALMAIARKAIGEITKSTVNWINSGFHGSPLFLENPQSFFNDIAKSEVKNLVDTFGYDRLKFPFGKEFALNTISSYKQTLEKNTAYSLSNVIKDQTVLNNYRNDWNFGGWNAFLVNTQYPQNNYIGFQMTATEELARRVQGTTQTAVKKIQETLQQGQGFLSPQICESNPKYNNMVNEFQKPLFPEKEYRDGHPSSQCTDQACLDKWRDNYEKAKVDWTEKNGCPGGLKSTTPGAVVSNQITMALGSQFRQTELGAAMGNSLSAIFDALLNKFIGEGLSALSSNTNPTTTPVDNWTYLGQNLSGPGDSDWANNPDQVVVLRDFRILIEGKTIVTFKENQQLLNENGELLVYGNENPIICKDGDKIVDSDGNTIEFCTRGESIACKVGEKIISKNHYEDGVGIDCVGEIKNIQYHTPETPILAEGGEIVTLIGDKTIDGNGKKIEGREYFKGDLENTIEETAIIDNPCEPNDDGCLKYNYKQSTPKYGLYEPGITQLVKPVLESTKELDQCIPGPDKGWEKRLESEHSIQERKLSFEAGSQDDLTARAAKSMISDLKFAVTAFKDWVKNKMDIAIPGAMFYLDAVDEIDNISQQTRELTETKRTKLQSITRLNEIKKRLTLIATNIWNNPDPKDPKKKPMHLTQPKPKSEEEIEMIKLKKEYDAIKPLISSSRSLDNARNQLQVLKDKLYSLNDSTKGLILRCSNERNALRTNGTTGNIWEKYPDGQDQPLEPFGICKKIGTTEKIPHVTSAQCDQIEQNDENGDAWDWTKSLTQRLDDLIGICKNSEGETIKEDVSRSSCLLLLQGVPSVLDEINYFCNIPINNGYSHGITIRRSDAGYCTNVGHAGSGSCDHEPIYDEGARDAFDESIIHGYGESAKIDNQSNWFVFRNNKVINGINRYSIRGKIILDDTGTKIRDEDGKILMDYGELPMVNAVDIEGDGTNGNWLSIKIGCDTIMKAKETDYTHAGDISF